MMLVKCLACDADNDPRATGGYCDSCGKKLPPASMVSPRRDRSGMTTDVPEPIAPRRSRISEALYSAAVVQLVAGGLFLILGLNLFATAPARFLTTVMLLTLVPTVGLALCGVLERTWGQMWPVVALVGYPVWIAIGFLIHPALAVGWLVVNGVVILVLLWVLWIHLRL